MASVILKNGVPMRRNWSVLDNFDNLMEGFLDGYPFGVANTDATRQMPIELSESDDKFLFKAMLPGLKKEDLNIEVSEDGVTVTGEYKEENKQDDDFIHASEFYTGKFSRSINLPQKIDHQKAKADYKDGILTIILPKQEKETNKVVKLSL